MHIVQGTNATDHSELHSLVSKAPGGTGINGTPVHVVGIGALLCHIQVL